MKGKVHVIAIEFDPTIFLIQLGIFFVAFLVLKTLVFDPYLKLLHARAAKTTGLKEAAEKTKAESAKLKADYDEFVKAERKKINAFVDDAKRLVADEERKIIESARSAAATEMEGVRKNIDAEMATTRKELAPLVGDFSSRIASKLVGSAVTVSGVSAERGKKNQEVAQG